MVKEMNRAGIAKHCGVSLSTVDAWIRKGAPCVKKGAKGREWIFNLDSLDTWRAQNLPAREEQSPELQKQRARLTRIQADRRELQLKLERGELIHAGRAMELWGAVIQIIAQRLSGMGTKLAPLLDGLNIVERKEAIDAYVNELRRELSNPDLKEVARTMKK